MQTLLLVLAAGGTIVADPRDMQDASLYKLVVTEDRVTGVKTYEAVKA